MGIINTLRRFVTRKDSAPLTGEDRRWTTASLPWWERTEDAWHTLSQNKKYQQLVDMNVGIVYACVNRNVAAVAQVPLRLYVAKGRSGLRRTASTRPVEKRHKEWLFKQAGLLPILSNAVDIEEVFEHPWLDLMRTANPFHNGFELLQLTEQGLELTGNNYWYLPGTSVPEAIWPMAPHLVRILKDPVKFISGYRYGTDQANMQTFDPSEVAHFKFPSVSSMYYGSGPLEAARVAAGLNQKFDLFEDAVIENGAAIPFFIAMKETLTDGQFKRIDKQISRRHKGYQKAGCAGILDGDATILQTAVNPKDMQYVEGQTITREKIADIFDVPMSLLTTSDVNRSNSESGLTQYMRFAIAPRCFRIQQVINHSIMPRYDERLFVAYDNPVPDDKAFALAERTADLASGVTIINEVREVAGQDPVAWGDEPWLPSKLRQPSEERAPEPSPFGGEPPVGGDEGEDDEGDKRYRKAATEFNLYAHETIVAPGVERKTLAWLNTTIGVIERRVIPENCTSPDTISELVSWEVVKVDGERKLLPAIKTSLQAGAAVAAHRVQMAMSFDVQHPFATDWAENYAGRQITVINEGTRQAIRSTVSQGIRDGLSIDDIARRVKPAVGLNERQAKALYKWQGELEAQGMSTNDVQEKVGEYKAKQLKYRAEMIARTETAQAFCEGELSQYADSDVQYVEFLASGDACPICRALDGKRYSVGDATGRIPVHPNCRCDWVPVVDEDKI